jgi:DNA mismatch endonuclease Vsr/nucleotidyltransferase AbiEii toxin of type IV toxin-antitoxin system
LAAINAAMKRMAAAIRDGLGEVHVNEVVNRAEGIVTKLTIQLDVAQRSRLRLPPVLRGCVFRPELRSVSPKVEEEFGFAETQVVSFSDLYRFTLHRKDLPGKPDIVFPRFKSVVFVHGCFWHQHKQCAKSALPATRQEFWGGETFAQCRSRFGE